MFTVNFWLEVEVVPHDDSLPGDPEADVGAWDFRNKEPIKIESATVASEADCIEVMKNAHAYDSLPDYMPDPIGRAEWEGEQLWRFIQDKTQQEAA